MPRRTHVAIAVITLLSVMTGCGSSPTSASDSAASATIDSVVTTYRGAVVDVAPVTIPSPDVLDVETRFTVRSSSAERLTLYLCVMETPSTIGQGTCVSLTSTVAEFHDRGDVVRMGISTFKTDGVARTLNYVYLALAEGAVPWNPLTGTPPRQGDAFGGNLVLATTLIPRTMTFR
jgi:hypothetical protein